MAGPMGEVVVSNLSLGRALQRLVPKVASKLDARITANLDSTSAGAGKALRWVNSSRDARLWGSATASQGQVYGPPAQYIGEQRWTHGAR